LVKSLAVFKLLSTDTQKPSRLRYSLTASSRAAAHAHHVSIKKSLEQITMPENQHKLTRTNEQMWQRTTKSVTAIDRLKN